MRYHVFATDYDGTLAHHGIVDQTTLDSLRRLRDSGRRIVLVTGRELEDLRRVFADEQVFDWIVAENGALIYSPSTKELRTLGPAPPPEFIEELKRRGVGPMSVGHVIVATWEPHEETALAVIRDLGLEMQVIFNKGAVMILPSGVNKATGLSAVLDEIGYSAHNTVGIGDAENDHAFLNLCECSVAVANALPGLKDLADHVTSGDHGTGVAQLVEMILAEDLLTVSKGTTRHNVRLGVRDDDTVESITPIHETLLICGTSGSGKSTLTTGVLERIAERGYQFVIVDPEGDYSDLPLGIVLGGAERAPLTDEVMNVLAVPNQNASVNLLGIPLQDRPEYADDLLLSLLRLRSQTGRPHWIVIDEAHHLLPETWNPAAPVGTEMTGLILVTVHPESVAHSILQTVTSLLIIGENPAQTLKSFCKAAACDVPQSPDIEALETGDTLLWRRPAAEAVLVHSDPPKSERQRHSRKYAEGSLGPDQSFYFQGPKGKLNLRCRNLVTFLEIAEGVDEGTWSYHLRRNDYSRWLKECVKDPALSEEVEAIEKNRRYSAQESLKAVQKAIEARYTLPEK
jgi:hydroxymethylpyrimidine pyrophosphatase-like HAD family hydrolase